MPSKYHDSFFDEPAAPRKVVHKKRAAKPEVKPIASSEPNEAPVFIGRQGVRDWQYEEAIKNLADILHPDEKAELAHILDPFFDKPELKQRTEDWRERNGIHE